MEDYSIGYDIGVNDDTYQMWRNRGEIGYVHLAMKVITEAMYDLVLGEYADMVSAHFFFFGDESESNYRIWAEVLGIQDGRLPDIVNRARYGHVSQNDCEYIRNLCTTVKTI